MTESPDIGYFRFGINLAFFITKMHSSISTCQTSYSETVNLSPLAFPVNYQKKKITCTKGGELRETSSIKTIRCKGIPGIPDF